MCRFMNTADCKIATVKCGTENSSWCNHMDNHIDMLSDTVLWVHMWAGVSVRDQEGIENCSELHLHQFYNWCYKCLNDIHKEWNAKAEGTDGTTEEWARRLILILNNTPLITFRTAAFVFKLALQSQRTLESTISFDLSIHHPYASMERGMKILAIFEKCTNTSCLGTYFPYMLL